MGISDSRVGKPCWTQVAIERILPQEPIEVKRFELRIVSFYSSASICVHLRITLQIM